MSLIAPDISDQAVRDEVPGVEVVLAATDAHLALLTPFALKLIGALQRRTHRRVESMMQRRCLGSTQPAQSMVPIDPRSAVVVADLRAAPNWHGRLDELELAAKELNEPVTTGNVVRTRGWNEFETGVLVDGRPVPAAVFDVAMVFSICVDRLRAGDVPFALAVPEPDDSDAARLWYELIRIAEGRAGADLGSVSYGTPVTS